MRMREKKRTTLAVAACGLGMLLVLGCSTDSPTAPVQDPMPPSGGTASAVWRITVSAAPNELTVGSTTPTTVSIRVVRADNNQPPPSGTTMVVSSSLGEFDSFGSGLRSLAVVTVNGFASALLFPGSVVGTAFVTAQLEGSAGQTSLPVLEEIEAVVASFSTSNSNNNLSIQFQNTSTGNPTKFQWDFGDGGTSTEEHPAHLYSLPGDYVVTLTASKTGSSDTTSQTVTVTDDLEASFEESIDGLTVVFRDASSGEPSSWLWNFGDGRTSSLQNPIHTYGRAGAYVVTLTVRKSRRSSEISKTITVDPEGVFVTGINPATGSAAGGTRVTIDGVGFVQPLRVLFGSILADVVSVTGATRIVVTTPPAVLATESCDDDNDGTVGLRDVDTPVTVTVELAATSGTVPGGFTYIPVDTSCRND
ncbi:MAG: PKD domain-containing protein [Acidobacteriota bacterium]|nr:PKD domain-containing protein [Acidobacteriota bacterium]